MGKIGKGIMGGFRGKVGTVQGTGWKGKDIVQAYNPNPNTPLTNAVLNQRHKFANCRAMLSGAKDAWEFVINGNGGKTLPAWQTWVKSSESTFGVSNDYSVDHPVINSLETNRIQSLINCTCADSGATSVIHVVNETDPLGDNIKLKLGVYAGAPFNKWVGFSEIFTDSDDWDFHTKENVQAAEYVLLYTFLYQVDINRAYGGQVLFPLTII